ncbi:MAG TPA: hypothetical protein VFJ98_02105, partial [Mycobacteriales bacterium]|nr:hypothetical protein [Mycobacteriales bacterium]
MGSTEPAPPALAILAFFSSLLAGKVWLAVSVLMLGAVPLSGLSAYLSAGAITRSPWLRIWAAVIWASLPALTGAVSGGRIDVVVTVILLPLAARAVAAVLRTDDSRLHRPVGAGLLLAVATAFSPVLWPATLLVAVGLSVLVPGRRLARLRSAAVLLVTAAAALVPWTLSVVQHPELMVRGLGLPEPLVTLRPLRTADLVLMHPSGPALPPVWVLAPLVLAAVVGLGRSAQRVAARGGFAVFLLAIAGSVVISRQDGAVFADPASRYWTGATAALGALGLLVAALGAGNLARAALRRYAFGWRQPAAGLVAASLLAGTGVAVVELLVHGVDRPLTGSTAALLPEFASAEVGRATAPRLLVLDGRGTDAEVRYGIIRDPGGLRLGDADVARSRPSEADNRLTDVVRRVAAGEAAALPRLAEFGVSMLVVRESGVRALSRLSQLDGLDRIPTTGASVWRVQMSTGELVVLGPRVASSVTGGAGL